MKEGDLPDWVKYVEGAENSSGIYELIESYLLEHVDQEVTNYLQVTYGFFAFYTEKLKDKVTKNSEYWDGSSIFLLYIHDCLRSLIVLHRYRHMSPMAFTLRSILESWITLKYIFLDPAERFDLYRRYENIEKYTAFKKGAYNGLNEDEAEKIKEENPEWFYKSGVKEKICFHWTARRNVSIFTMAENVGLLDEYNSYYFYTSIATHCSSILRNSYIGVDGISPIPRNDQTTLFAFIGAHFSLMFLKDVYDFFGIIFPDDQKSVIDRQMLSLSKKYGAPFLG